MRTTKVHKFRSKIPYLDFYLSFPFFKITTMFFRESPVDMQYYWVMWNIQLFKWTWNVKLYKTAEQWELPRDIELKEKYIKDCGCVVVKEYNVVKYCKKHMPLDL